MRNRISTLAFAEKFNLLRMRHLGEDLSIQDISVLLAEKKLYHSRSFVSKLIKAGMFEQVGDKLYSFTQRPVYHKRFEKLLEDQYSSNKRYVENYYAKKVSTDIQISEELANAIEICRQNGFTVSKTF